MQVPTVFELSPTSRKMHTSPRPVRLFPDRTMEELSPELLRDAPLLFIDWNPSSSLVHI